MNVPQDSDSREFVHRIDLDDRLCLVNDAWLAFAEENGWRVGADAMLGTGIMSHVADAETRHIYRMLIDRVREAGHPARFHYRCDSPTLRRYMEMRMIRCRQGEIEFRSRVLRLERREPIRVLDSALPHSRDQRLQICSWCKAVYVQRTWLGLEEAVQRLGLFADAVLPQLSHGICPACSDRMTDLGVAP
jgi:hypothetical protein